MNISLDHKSTQNLLTCIGILTVCVSVALWISENRWESEKNKLETQHSIQINKLSSKIERLQIASASNDRTFEVTFGDELFTVDLNSIFVSTSEAKELILGEKYSEFHDIIALDLTNYGYKQKSYTLREILEYYYSTTLKNGRNKPSTINALDEIKSDVYFHYDKGKNLNSLCGTVIFPEEFFNETIDFKTGEGSVELVRSGVTSYS